jgi:hypothetical protein
MYHNIIYMYQLYNHTIPEIGYSYILALYSKQNNNHIINFYITIY